MDSNENARSFVPFLLLASVAAIVVGNRDKPFQVPRSNAATTETSIVATSGGHRLWEDPLTDLLPKANRPEGAKPTIVDIEQLGAAMPLCVTVPSDNTAEAAEFRRRTRFAVEAAITVAGYKPRDAEQILHLPSSMVRGEPALVPFETFERDVSNAEGRDGAAGAFADASSEAPDQVRFDELRVFWVDERAFSLANAPPGTGLLQRVLQRLPSGDVPYALIGPTSSGALSRMTTQAFPIVDAPAPLRPPICVYSPWATQYAGAWIDAGTPRYERQLTVDGQPVPVKRTIVADQLVAKALVEELANRSIEADDHVLLVVERDSDFARAWQGHLRQTWLDHFHRTDSFTVAMFSRGLDGLLKADPGGTSVELPEGPSTLDYLRRLREAEPERGRVRAVGIFCQDVNDKLLVLQALRPVMREALFFTNDLDAYYGHPSTRSYTRNLIVASCFALDASEGMHLLTPFRDQYQTSVFEAVLDAIRQAEGEWVERGSAGVPGVFHKRDQSDAPDASMHRSLTGSDIANATGADRDVSIFEIGSNGPIQLPTRSAGSTAEFTLFLLVVLILFAAGVAYGLRGTSPRSVLRELSTSPWTLAFLLLAAALPLLVAAVLQVRGEVGAWREEPFTVFGGISIWPTEILRLLAFELALVYGAVLLANLRLAFASIDERFENASRIWQVPNPLLRSKRLGPWLQRYYSEPRTHLRALTALAAALLFFGVGQAAFAFTGYPHAPARGALAADLDRILIGLSVVAMLWLLFLVVGTNVRIAWLVRRLELGHLLARRQTGQAEPKDDFDLRSHVVFLQNIEGLGGNSLYGPFLVVLVLILSRWQGFDDWTWPPVLVTLVATSCLLALASSFALTASARASRNKAVRLADERLTTAIVAADGSREKVLVRLRLELTALSGGVFAGISGHPAVRAILIPTGGIGGLSLLNLLA